MAAGTIALLFEYPTLNGGERSMLAVLDALRAESTPFRFVAIAPPAGRLADALHNREVALCPWSPWDEAGRRRDANEVDQELHQIVSAIEPDLLHANSLSMSRLTGRLASRLPVPTTGHLRDIIKLSAAAISDLNRNRRLIAVSKATRDFHMAQAVNGDRITVVYNGVNLDEFQPRPPSGRLHAELGLLFGIDPNTGSVGNDGRQELAHALPVQMSKRNRGLTPPARQDMNRPARIIVTIGQIGLRKGQDVLARSASQIALQIPDVHFVLIGERSSQKQESVEFEQAIQAAFEHHGLSDRLHWLGQRNDVAALLNDIDLLIHPAKQEPFGRVLLEASACGVPIVATDVGGTSEIIVPGITGLLVPPGDASAIAEAAIELLADDDKSQSFRSAARQHAVEQFPITAAARRIADLWEAVLTTT